MSLWLDIAFGAWWSAKIQLVSKSTCVVVVVVVVVFCVVLCVCFHTSQ
jgi:hypothetical protein